MYTETQHAQDMVRNLSSIYKENGEDFLMKEF